MSTPTDTRRDLLTVIVYMQAQPGKDRELRDLLESLVEPTSKEQGFVNYDLHEKLGDPSTFFLYENWESEAALEDHFATPHLQRFMSRVDDLLVGGADGLHLTKLRRIV